MKLNEENVKFIHTPKIKEKNFSSKNLASVIIPTSNNSQTNFRNIVKISFCATREVNFTILLKNLGVYIEKN